MKKHKLAKIDLDIYEETLDNGLTIYVIPNHDVNATYVTFSTRFGSIEDKFIPIDAKEMISVPKGVAHFLEHKMFEQKDQIDPFSFYSERGCDCNANTSNYKTTYLFSGTNFIEEGINYLLDFVQDPYFTDENVSKEQGIIGQEIKMYDDIPFWKMYDGMIYNAFVKHPIKYPIAGTIETISHINKEILYQCYNTFYHPANMFVVVTGNVEPQSIVDIISKNQSKKTFLPFKNIELPSYDEPDQVSEEKTVYQMNVSIPKVGVGYKINIKNTVLDKNTLLRYIKLMIDIKTGTTSTLFEELKDKDILNSDIDFIAINTDDHIFVELHATTNKVDEYLQLLDKEMQNIDISEIDFNRKKNLAKTSLIYNSDSIYQMNELIMDNLIDYGKVIYDETKLIDDMSYQQYNEIKSKISLQNKTIYIIEPK